MLLELNDVSKSFGGVAASQEYLLALNKVKYLVLLVQMVLVRRHCST